MSRIKESRHQALEQRVQEQLEDAQTQHAWMRGEIEKLQKKAEDAAKRKREGHAETVKVERPDTHVLAYEEIMSDKAMAEVHGLLP